MKCDKCSKNKEELFNNNHPFNCPYAEWYCNKCYKDVYGITEQEFKNEFQIERRDQPVLEFGVSQRQDVSEFEQSEDAS